MVAGRIRHPSSPATGLGVCGDAARALAIHRTLQKTVAQPETAKAPMATLAQLALRVVMDQADAKQVRLTTPQREQLPPHAPPPEALAFKPPKRATGGAAFQLESAVGAYVETLTQARPLRPCTLATHHVLPHLMTLRHMTPSAPRELLAVIDLQNMLLQATWQPELSVLWFAAVGRWTSWLGLSAPVSTPSLAMRRLLSTSLAANVMQLWHGMLDQAAHGRHAASFVSALARWPLISEVCDYDVLRRSLTPARAPMLDVKALQTRLFEAVDTPGLSVRAALQLRLLAWRLAVFEPCLEQSASGGAHPRFKRFAQLREELQGANARIWASAFESDVPSDTPEPDLQPAASSSNAKALRRAEALTELVAATWAFRRGVRDVAEH